MIGRRRAVDQVQSLLDQDLAGHLAQRGPRRRHVPREAREIDLGQDIAERFIGQAEAEIVLPARLLQMTDASMPPAAPPSPV